MAAAGDPMIELLAKLAALAASNATLQGQVALMQPEAQAMQPTTYARTPAFRGQTELMNFGKKANLSVYVEGKRPVLKGDERFDVKTETLGPFLQNAQEGNRPGLEQCWQRAADSTV